MNTTYFYVYKDFTKKRHGHAAGRNVKHLDTFKALIVNALRFVKRTLRILVHTLST